MLGTALLIAIVVCGYIHMSFWVLLPATVGAAFVGMHYPPGKAHAAKERGIYWRALMYSIPIMAVMALVLFGIGWSVGAIFE